MKITKKRLFDFCNENNDALNDLQSQSDSTDFVLSTLIDQLKNLGVIDKLGDEPSEPKLKQLDQSIFDGLDAKWQWATMSSVGIPFVYSYKPAGNRAFFSDSTTQELINAERVMRINEHGYDTTDWQNSLIERDIAKELLEVDLSSELTGSDLCRKMLERGDRYVMCMVDDGTDVICDLACFVSSTHPYIGRLNNYRQVTPINNQGEPLTAADVGL